MATTNLVELITQEKIITGEELYQLGDIGRCELIEGRIVHMASPGVEHGQVELSIGWRMAAFVSAHALGKVMSGEVGIYIHRNPDTVRGADLAYFSPERAAQ